MGLLVLICGGYLMMHGSIWIGGFLVYFAFTAGGKYN